LSKAWIRRRIAELNKEVACHGGIYYEKHDTMAYIDRNLCLERTPTVLVPSEGNLCTIWGLWETHEGSKVRWENTFD
jgi:hypothetical protein